jgi:hypothetical protein
LVALAIAAPVLSASTPTWPEWVDFSGWSDLGEAYRQEFARCDRENNFRGQSLNQRIGRRYYYGCVRDPNRVTMLKKAAPAAGSARGLIAFTSKLSIDLDGSWYACNTPGKTDLCPTSLSLVGASGGREPVSSDLVAYIAIPVSGPSNELSREFRDKSGIDQGDFGVVVSGDTIVPVIVADGGPFSKLGEGSIALHRRLGQELCRTKDTLGRCTTIVEPQRSLTGPFVTVIEPGSRRRDVTAANVTQITKSEGERIWASARERMGRGTSGNR